MALEMNGNRMTFATQASSLCGGGYGGGITTIKKQVSPSNLSLRERMNAQNVELERKQTQIS